MQDNLVFSAGWKSKPMTAQEVIDSMREFLVGLMRISPWTAPFDVSGSTAGLSHMPIADDLSDFEELVLKAMGDPGVRFYSESEPDTMLIRPDSKTVFGMQARFSDYPQKKLKNSSVTIDIGMGSSNGSGISGLDIKVPFYAPYIEENGAWAMSEGLQQPEAIFDYIINHYGPCFCSIYSSKFLLEVTEWGKDINSPIGCLSYVRSPKVVDALRGDRYVREYRDGVLIELGNGPVVFKDTQARAEAKIGAVEIRDKLRRANATNWMEM